MHLESVNGLNKCRYECEPIIEGVKSREPGQGPLRAPKRTTHRMDQPQPQPQPQPPHQPQPQLQPQRQPQSRVEAPAGSCPSSFDPLASLRVILLDECCFLFDSIPKRGHPSVDMKAETLAEIVLGSVALNFGAQSPATKIHEINADLLMTSLVFGHEVSRKGTVDRRCSGAVRGSSVSVKFGLTIIWDVRGFPQIKELIYSQSYIIDCLINNLKDDMMAGLMAKSSEKVNEATKKFLNPLNSTIGAQVLATDVSLQVFVRDLVSLIKEIDTKQTNFFFSKLVSMLLMYKNYSNAAPSGAHLHPEENLRCKSSQQQIVVTTSSGQRKNLLTKLLVVINYFMSGNKRFEEKSLADPIISVNLPSPDHHQQQHQLQAEGSLSGYNYKHHTLTPNKAVTGGRKSRDESLGYGSLSDSGSSNECGESPFTRTYEAEGEAELRTEADCEAEKAEDGFLAPGSPERGAFFDEVDGDLPIRVYRESSPTPIINQPSHYYQSKLYIKEYQKLRFHSPPCTGIDGCLGGKECPPVAPEQEADHQQDQEEVREKGEEALLSLIPRHERPEDLAHDVFESKSLPGFYEMRLPEVSTKRPAPKPLGKITRESERRASYSRLSEGPVLGENRLLPHIKLQGIVKKKTCSLFNLVENMSCKCSSRARLVIHADCDNWSVNLVDLESDSVIPGLMCTQIGYLCETLSVLHSIDMNEHFVMGYLESKLKELTLKSQVLKTLSSEHTLFKLSLRSPSGSSCSGTGSMGSTFNGLLGSIDSWPVFPPLLGFDSSDVPLLSSLQKVHSHREQSVNNRLLLDSNRKQPAPQLKVKQQMAETSL